MNFSVFTGRYVCRFWELNKKGSLFMVFSSLSFCLPLRLLFLTLNNYSMPKFCPAYNLRGEFFVFFLTIHATRGECIEYALVLILG